MFNRVILIGNLTKDPDMRYGSGGTPVATLRLACTTKRKGNNGPVEDTLFIDVVVFGKQAENCNHYLTKGSQALVEGRLVEQKWEKDGMQRSKVEIIAQSVRFLSKAKGGSSVGANVPDEHSELEPF